MEGNALDRSRNETLDTLHTMGFYLKLMSAIAVHCYAFLLVSGFLLRSNGIDEIRFILKAIILWLIGFVICRIAERIERLDRLRSLEL